MVGAADIPIIGGLLDAISTYFRRTAFIIRHPILFARPLANKPPGEALRFITASIIISYLLSIPLLLKSESDTSQALLILYFFLSTIFTAIPLHFTLRILGSRRPLLLTIKCHFYVVGAFGPIIYIMFMPVMMKAQPKRLLGPIDYASPTPPAHSDEIPLLLTSLSVALLCTTIAYVWEVIFLKIVHQLKVWKIIISVLVAIWLGSLINNYSFAPMWIQIEKYIQHI